MESCEDFDIIHIRTNYSDTFDDIGRMSLKKAKGFINVILKIILVSIKSKPDLVYMMPATADFGYVRDFSFLMLLKLFRRNIILHLRAQITENDRSNWLKNKTLKLTFGNNQIIVLGKELVHNISPYVDPSNIFILPNAIKNNLTDDEFYKIIEQRKVEKTLRLTFLSNMMKSKGWQKVLMAANILKIQAVDFKLTFAGSWPSNREEEDYYNMVKQYNLEEECRHIGYVNSEGKHELLSNSNILVFPTENDTFGRVIIEAMEYGIPVIANSVGAIPSIINHNKTGFLLSDNSPEEIAGYILYFIENRIMIKMGLSARKRFLNFYELNGFKKRFLKIIFKSLNRN